MADDELRCIKTYLNRVEADMASSLLESHGIISMIQADDYGGMGPHLGYGAGVKLFVRAPDAEQALDILGQTS